MLGHRIGGKRLGIIGMGRIGRAVARRARPFGLSIAYHNRHRLPFEVEQELDAQWQGDLDALLAESDILSIHCPLNADSRGLVDARRIGLLRPDAYVINTSRAEIMDEGALSGHLTAAGNEAVFPALVEGLSQRYHRPVDIADAQASR